MKELGFCSKIFKDGNYTVSNLNIDEGESISIYPNPCGEFISFKGGSGSQMVFEVTNALGQIVLKRNVTADERVDTAQLPIGAYFFSLSNKNGKLVRAETLLKN